MDEITRARIARVGVDLAKQVIQVHAVDASGRRVVARAFKRDQFFAWCTQLPAGCVVAMEACSSAHHWARKLRALGLDARLIAANFVTPYRMEGKSGKNDATDATAICEAASRPGMRFVPVKTCEQQGVMSLHRVREGLKEERTACINQIRGVLTEFGLVFGKSPKVLRAVLADVIEDASNELSTTARLVVQRAFEHWRELDEHMKWCDRQVGQHVRASPEAKRAAKVIGIGELGASALTAGVGDFTQFKSGHQFGAWLGVVPPAPGLQRRQDPSRAHHKARRRLPPHAADTRRQGRGDERRQTRRPDLALAGATDGARGLAESLRGHGQQERSHPVGSDDARGRVRSETCQRQAAGQAIDPATRRGCTVEPRRLRGLIAAACHDTPINPATNPDSFHPRRALEDAFDRSDRQLVNSINRAWRQSCPTPYREWSPAERFVSGSAPTGATRPFVDVQSVLCRTAASTPHVLNKTQPETKQPA